MKLAKKIKLFGMLQKIFKNILLELTILGWPNNVSCNINFPYCTADLVKSIQITTQGNRETDDLIINEVRSQNSDSV